ncbi:MAG: LuxR family transcriptional regulator [Denitromonas halophila]|jgi:DNA-binding CsgD family transcriptional regulator|nr:MAG: LuxR family transcriptional regulator [Denitromonas halophila]TVT65252.1 MAG: LuxR family transcriptional regulator [Denitromonas halophila]
MRLQDHLDHLLRARSDDTLSDAFETAISQFGYDRYLFALLNDHPELDQSAQHGLMHSYPEDWMAHYVKQGYEHIDPVRFNTIHQSVPFEWKSLRDAPEVTVAQKQLLHEADNAGLKHGIGIPLHGPRGTSAGIGLASSSKSAAPSAREITQLHMLALQFYACFWRLHKKRDAGKAPGMLSTREMDVLKWLAQGLTKAEIGDKLHISTHTVDHHTRNILSKLNARNITAAVYFATSRGLIPLY